MRSEQQGDVMKAKRQKSSGRRVRILLEKSMFHLCNGQGVSHIKNKNNNNTHLLNEYYFSPSHCKNIGEDKVVKFRSEE